MDNYLSVLEDSLKKKLQILDELTDYTTQQQELLKVEELNNGQLLIRIRRQPEKEITDLGRTHGLHDAAAGAA